MSGFTTHREVHDAPGGYCVRTTIELLGAGMTIDVRSDTFEADYASCPWLGDGTPGHHTVAQRKASAILKYVALYAPDPTPNGLNVSFIMAESAAAYAGGEFIGDTGGRLDLTWPSAAKATSFYLISTGGDIDPVYMELWFDIPVAPA